MKLSVKDNKNVLISSTAYKVTLWEKIRSNRSNYLMLAPFMILFFVFTVMPVLSSVFLSFTNFNLLQTPRWVGWANYIRLFLDDEVFMISVKNTLIFAFITGPISYFICLILAWLINELPPKIRAVLTFVFYAPSISGNLYVIWKLMFNSDAYGFINGFLMKWGILYEPKLWLTDPKTVLLIIILVQLWLSLGSSFLAFIAGLQSIDKQMYEAAAIDGVRNRWQELWYITLPSMGPQLMFGAVMQISSSFAVSSISISLAGLPSTDYAAHTVVTHIIDHGTIRFEMGYASAIAAVLFITMMLTNKVIRSLLRKVAD